MGSLTVSRHTPVITGGDELDVIFGKRMSEKYVEKGSYVFFPMPDIVEEVQNFEKQTVENKMKQYLAAPPSVRMSGSGCRRL